MSINYSETPNELPEITESGWIKKKYKPYVKKADRVAAENKKFSETCEVKLEEHSVPNKVPRPEIIASLPNDLNGIKLEDLQIQLNQLKNTCNNLYKVEQISQNKLSNIFKFNFDLVISDLKRAGEYVAEMKSDAESRMKSLKDYTIDGYKKTLYEQGIERSNFIHLNMLKEDALYFEDFNKRITSSIIDVLNNASRKIEDFIELMRNKDVN